MSVEQLISILSAIIAVGVALAGVIQAEGLLEEWQKAIARRAAASQGPRVDG